MSLFGFLGGITAGFGMLLFCLYFLPTIIALISRKSNTGAIFALNLFLGWTFVGWIISIVWAVAGSSQPEQVIIHNTIPVQGSAPQPISHPAPASPQYTSPTLQKASGTAGSRTAAPSNKFDQLRQLKELLDSGALTQEEFDQQKSRLLA